MRSGGRNLRPISILVVSLFLLASLCISGAQPKTELFVDLRQFKREIEHSIQQGRRVSDQPPYFIIQKVVLNLQVEMRQGASGSLGFAVPVFATNANLAAEGAQTALEKLEIELIPPENTIVGGERTIDLVPFIRALKDVF